MNESKTVEFKREFSESIKKSIVAFANSDGGTIYIGIDDDGTVIGLNRPDEVSLQVTNAVRDAIRPDVTLFVECSIKGMDGKQVVVITVECGTARPYYMTQKGLRPEGVYVRQGSSSVPATETAILNMIKETSGDCYESARSLNQQLTFEKTEEIFDKMGVALGKGQKVTLGFIDSNDTYTNLGLLFSDQCVHTIKLAFFEGVEKAVFKERREFSGSILSQIEAVIHYIERYNRTRAEFEGFYRIDQKDYPEEAVREALFNAVVHRDYSFSGSTLISMFDDRIEFVTIGGLVRGVSLDDIEIGVSMPRNQKLAHVFYRLKLIEAYGTGVLKMINAYNKFLEQPLLETASNSFKVTLPNINYHKERARDTMLQVRDVSTSYTAAPLQLTDRELEILGRLERQTSIIRKDVEAITGLSQDASVVLLRNMVKKGLLVKVGSGKSVQYKLPR